MERIVYSTGGDVAASWPWIRAMVEVELRCCDGSPAFVRERSSEVEEEEEEEEPQGSESSADGAMAGGGALRPFAAAATMQTGAAPLAPHAVGAAMYEECSWHATAPRRRGRDAVGDGGAPDATDEDDEDGAEGGGEESMGDAEEEGALEEAQPVAALTRHRMRCSNMRRLALADVESVSIHHVESSSSLIPRREGERSSFFYCLRILLLAHLFFCLIPRREGWSEGIAVMRLAASAVSCLLCTVTFHANHAHSSTRSP